MCCATGLTRNAGVWPNNNQLLKPGRAQTGPVCKPNCRLHRAIKTEVRAVGSHRSELLPAAGVRRASRDHLLHGQRPFSSVVVHPVVGDGGELPAAVVFVVDVVRHVLQVLHVSPEGAKKSNRMRRPGRPKRDPETVLLSVPDEHVPEDGEVAVVTVFNCSAEQFGSETFTTRALSWKAMMTVGIPGHRYPELERCVHLLSRRLLQFEFRPEVAFWRGGETSTAQLHAEL